MFSKSIINKNISPSVSMPSKPHIDGLSEHVFIIASSAGVG
jgi:hypothetical protein